MRVIIYRIFKCGFLVMALVVLLTACGKNTVEKWQEQYDLGMQYLEDGDYEAAIVAFTAAIEIDPKEGYAYVKRGGAYILSGETEENLASAFADYESVLSLYDEALMSGEDGIPEELSEALVQAYLGIADVYIRQRDYDSALEILEEGLEKTGGNEEIAGKIEEIKAGTITDSSGNIRRLSSYDGEGVLQWYHELTYRSDGKQASVTSFDSSGNQTGHIELEYDEDGRMLVAYYYRGNSGEVGKQELLYDGSDYITQRNWYDLDGTLDQVYIYNYDSDGNVTTIECYDSEGELEYTEYYEYNELDQQVKRTISYSDGHEAYYLYEYDAAGNQIRVSCYRNGELASIMENLYDDDGNYIGYKTYDGDGNLTQSVINE